MNTTLRGWRWLGAAAMIIGGTSPAAAQPAPRAPRVGLELAAGLWGGEINCTSRDGACDGVTEAGGVNLHAAYMLRPTLGVAVDFWPMVHQGLFLDITHYVTTVALQWRPMPILTALVGVGSAHATYDGGDIAATSRDAPGVLLAVGVDVIRARRWAIDLQARVGAGFYGDDAAGDLVARNVGVGGQLTYLLR